MTSVNGKSPLSLKIAQNAYKSARLKRVEDVAPALIIANLAKVLMVTHPRSEHGRLLMGAMRGVVPIGSRTDAELAVRYLLSHGQTPTPEAVSGRLESVMTYRTAKKKRDAFAASIVQEHGPEIARLINQRIRETGKSYTWQELHTIMGWPRARIYRQTIMKELESAGWIKTGSDIRSLRPGTRFRELPTDYR